jgi:hypothetical protein
MPDHKNGLQHASSSPQAPPKRVQLTERERRWTTEFESEGVSIVRTTRPLPKPPQAAPDHDPR